MEIKLNIKIEGLDQLTESLALIGSALAYKNNMVPTAKAAVDLMDEATKPKPKKTETKKEKVKEVKTEKPVATEKEDTDLTLEDVRAAFVAKNSPSTRDELKAILDKFNVPNVSALEEENFSAVLNELEAI